MSVALLTTKATARRRTVRPISCRRRGPFVGPAGQLLDRALDAAAIDRDEVYLTNVVKHFKWEPRGKRRLHKRPLQTEIAACMPWLRIREADERHAAFERFVTDLKLVHTAELVRA